MGCFMCDLEFRFIVNNIFVVNFMFVVNRCFKCENDQDVDFIFIVVWSRFVEFLKNYFKKGR